MGTSYTSERNVQVLISLMKQHGVKKVIASPGTTNITFVASIQQDDFFEIYSSVDERSAAYMACGMAAESGEPVALSCTGATASRNYLPGLTEAYYRKLPVLAVTSSQHLGRVGQMVPQVIDRTAQMNDVCKVSVQVPSVHDAEDLRGCELAINRALLALTKDGGGPAHVNLVTTYSKDFSIKDLPQAHMVGRIGLLDSFPSLQGKRVAVFVGSHRPFDEALASSVDAFCSAYDAVVICDHTSNYYGRYRVLGPLMLSQTYYMPHCSRVDVLVHIGEISGAYAQPKAAEVWRVSPDGEVRDPFGGLHYVFDMGEREFFDTYAREVFDSKPKETQLDNWIAEDARLREKMPELPFSNAWCAQQAGTRIPKGTALHLGILNTLRCWNMFPVTKGVDCFCNTGGFGIDGGVSSLIGASLAAPSRLFLGVVGDLACFYDLNSLGNRHIGPNVRLMVVNNGVGTEFKNYNHPAARFGQDADAFMAARGHFGAQSRDLLRHYSTDLGFEYLCATDKESFLAALDRFVDPQPHDAPLLLEVFTDSNKESDAIRTLNMLEQDATATAKKAIKSVLGDKGVAVVKRMMGR